MRRGLLRLAPVSVSQVQKAAAKAVTGMEGFCSNVMRTVDFQPTNVSARDNGAMGFPWKANRGALNGFNSAHGGALAILADAFTRIHMNAANPGAEVSSVSFEISYLNAVQEGEECTCVTRLVSDSKTGLHHMEYSFEDKKGKKVFSRGIHVLSCSQ
uniref:Thioesterase domain-containing protein n=1 Tax=Trypanosoma congolense (strain IL3000) TaxID=1068625 RepID=G0UX06_TRYCI|nr:conserved hypothetical protein [Trypanosoma congolense IL3000]